MALSWLSGAKQADGSHFLFSPRRPAEAGVQGGSLGPRAWNWPPGCPFAGMTKKVRLPNVKIVPPGPVQPSIRQRFDRPSQADQGPLVDAGAHNRTRGHQRTLPVADYIRLHFSATGMSQFVPFATIARSQATVSGKVERLTFGAVRRRRLSSRSRRFQPHWDWTRRHGFSASDNLLASFKSSVSKPSVNQP